ncbi:hypothetical protein WN55_04089 [Dufourea novaeangliae]|uniref:Uncharacterized protein n=1 Tax=Dufourea novaeangliae TaxID=178035 RepID=A0A154PKA7_DUFNO|nr:hypothetical protein WN55_04089 [Dufourea novaeangliae]
MNFRNNTLRIHKQKYIYAAIGLTECDPEKGQKTLSGKNVNILHIRRGAIRMESSSVKWERIAGGLNEVESNANAVEGTTSPHASDGPAGVSLPLEFSFNRLEVEEPPEIEVGFGTGRDTDFPPLTEARDDGQ